MENPSFGFLRKGRLPTTMLCAALLPVLIRINCNNKTLIECNLFSRVPFYLLYSLANIFLFLNITATVPLILCNEISDHLGIDFIKNILLVIEAENSTEISDLLLTLLLSYNLQFKPKAVANITVQAVMEAPSVKTFTEKVLLLINREGILLLREQLNILFTIYIIVEIKG